MSNKEVAVIGAGPMGLAVAYQLIQDGYKPVIYEADDRVGGMTATFEFCGSNIERYYHFHCTSDADFLQLLKELRIDDKMNWKPTNMGYWFNNMLQPWGNPIALLKFKGVSLVAKFRYGLHAFLSTKRNDWKPLEKYDAQTWIIKNIGQEAYDKLWKNLFNLKFHKFTPNLSAPWIWSRIRRIGRSRYSIMQEKLGYLTGGSKTLLDALSEYVSNNGGQIHLSTPVSKIDIVGGNVQGIIVNGKSKYYDTVISTVPLPIAANMADDLPEDLLAKYKNRNNIGCICIIVKLKQQLTENFWLNTSDDNMDIPGIIEYGNLNPDVGHIVYVPYYLPQDHPTFSDTDEQFKEKVMSYFKAINSSISDDDLIDIRVNRYQFAQPICEPNFMDNLPDVKTPAEGLWIADTSHYYPEDRGISESIGFGRNLVKRVLNNAQ